MECGRLVHASSETESLVTQYPVCGMESGQVLASLPTAAHGTYDMALADLRPAQYANACMGFGLAWSPELQAVATTMLIVIAVKAYSPSPPRRLEPT